MSQVCPVCYYEECVCTEEVELSASAIARIATAVCDELERRKEERRVEEARARTACMWCDCGFPVRASSSGNAYHVGPDSSKTLLCTADGAGRDSDAWREWFRQNVEPHWTEQEIEAFLKERGP